MEDSILRWLILAFIVAVLFGGILYKEARIHPKEPPNEIERQVPLPTTARTARTEAPVFSRLCN